MAREAYRSLYGDLTKLKDNSLLADPAGGGTYNDELFQLLLAVSALVDGYCNRHFYPRTTTLTFDGPADSQLRVRDLVSLTSLTSDDDDDGAYETTWASTDYELVPQNANPTQHWGAPYTALRVLSRGTSSGSSGVTPATASPVSGATANTRRTQARSPMAPSPTPPPPWLSTPAATSLSGRQSSSRTSRCLSPTSAVTT